MPLAHLFEFKIDKPNCPNRRISFHGQKRLFSGNPELFFASDSDYLNYETGYNVHQSEEVDYIICQNRKWEIVKK